MDEGENIGRRNRREREKEKERKRTRRRKMRTVQWMQGGREGKKNIYGASEEDRARTPGMTNKEILVFAERQEMYRS